MGSNVSFNILVQTDPIIHTGVQYARSSFPDFGGSAVESRGIYHFTLCYVPLKCGACAHSRHNARDIILGHCF